MLFDYLAVHVSLKLAEIDGIQIIENSQLLPPTFEISRKMTVLKQNFENVEKNSKFQ